MKIKITATPCGKGNSTLSSKKVVNVSSEDLHKIIQKRRRESKEFDLAYKKAFLQQLLNESDAY